MSAVRPILSPHDTGVTPWVIVAVYGCAAVACLRAWRIERRCVREPEAHATRQSIVPGFWLLVAVALLLLGVNKQLDAHVWVTQLGRSIARSHGWYKERRMVQLAFVLLLAIVAMAGLVAGSYRLRHALRHYGLALAGLCALVVYVGLRVVSFHHVDAWLGTKVHGMKLHWLIELAAGTMILTAALTAGRSRQRSDTVSR